MNIIRSLQIPFQSHILSQQVLQVQLFVGNRGRAVNSIKSGHNIFIFFYIEDEDTYDLLIRQEGTDEERKGVEDGSLEYGEDALHIDSDLESPVNLPLHPNGRLPPKAALP